MIGPPPRPTLFPYPTLSRPLAWIAARIWGTRRVAAPASRALAAVFAIDFVLLLAAAQHEAARYFQPLMPVVAVAVVRPVLLDRKSTRLNSSHQIISYAVFSL